jgi:hypothetical protein
MPEEGSRKALTTPALATISRHFLRQGGSAASDGEAATRVISETPDSPSRTIPRARRAPLTPRRCRLTDGEPSSSEVEDL